MRKKDRTLTLRSVDGTTRDVSEHDDASDRSGRQFWGRSRLGSPAPEWAAADDPDTDLGDLEDGDLDDEIVELLVDEAGSIALARWRDRLSRYIDQQGALDALRLRTSTEPPWPSIDNPMLGYLIERGAEIGAGDGFDVALAWLAANAWFEGVIAERARIARRIDEE